MASGSGIRAGAAFVEVGMKDKLTGGLKRLEKRFKNFGASMAAVGSKLAFAGAAITGSLLASTKAFASAGDQIEKMSLKTGFSAEELGRLKFAMEQSGGSIGTLDKAVKGMQTQLLNLGRGLSTAVDSFNDLGLSAKDFIGLNAEQKFELISKRLAAVGDVTKRAGLALSIFGRAGRDMLPFLAQGTAGIAALKNKADELGIVLTTKQVKAAAKFTDAWNIITQQLKAVVFQIGGALAPELTKLISKIEPVLKQVIDWVKANKSLATTLLKIGVATTAAGAAMLGTALAINLVIPVFKAFRLAITATRIAMTFLLGISGVGWVQIAAGIGVAVAATALLASQLGETEKAADDAQKAVAGVAKEAGNLGKTASQSVNSAAGIFKTMRDLIQQSLTPAEKLRAELIKLSRTKANLSDIFSNETFIRLRNKTIEAATGIIGSMQSVQDEIALLEGTATRSGIALNKMFKAGVPEDLLKQFQKLQAARDALREQEGILGRQRAEAESIRGSVQTPGERFATEADRLARLRKTIDPSTGKALLDPETFSRALGKSFDSAQIAINLQNAIDRTGVSGSRIADATSARSGEGISKILAATQGVEGRADQETAKNTADMKTELMKLGQKLDAIKKNTKNQFVASSL